MPPTGIPLLLGTAGLAEVRGTTLCLDEDESVLRWRLRSGRAAESMTFTLMPGEFEIFDIEAVVTRGWVAWVLVVDFIAAGENGSITVPTSGDRSSSVYRLPCGPRALIAAILALAADRKQLTDSQPDQRPA